jgi:hypothetical protein
MPQFSQVAVDLRRALFEAGLRLGQLQRRHLCRMEGLLRLLHRTPRRTELALGLGQRLLGRALHFARRHFRGDAHFEHAGQFVDLALAFDDAVGLGIRYVQRESRGSQQVSGARYALAGTQRQFGGEIVSDGYAGQPFV